MTDSYKIFEEKNFIQSGMSDGAEKLAGLAHREIFIRILMLQFPPGALLQERQLAESLGMSRTPVREALMRLSQEGWVTTNARRHSEVKKLTRDDVREVMDVRRFFELRGLEAVMEEGRSSKVPAMLAASHERMATAPWEMLVFILEDQCFHRVLVAAGGNSRLNAFYAQTSFEVIRMGLVALKGRGSRVEGVQEEHSCILDAIASGRKKDARAALCRHLDVTEAMISRYIKDFY